MGYHRLSVIPSAVRDHTLLLVPRKAFAGECRFITKSEKGVRNVTYLEVRGLQVAFAGERGNTIGTDRIDFFVDQGETVCLVGESGCGKVLHLWLLWGFWAGAAVCHREKSFLMEEIF